MNTDIKEAAIRFRFGKREEFSAEFKEFLRTHVDEVSRELPQRIGEALFTYLELEVPASFAGKVEADGNSSIRDLVSFMIAEAAKPTSETRTIDQMLEYADSADGRQRVRLYLASKNVPLYGSDSERSDLILETQADGTRRVGRFKRGRFEQVAD